MADLAEVLAGLGITPRPGGRSARARDYGVTRRPALPPVGPSAASNPVSAPGGPIQFANAVPLDVAPAGGSLGGGDDDGFSVGGLFKKAGMGILDALDTGRGYGVSAVKELGDLGQGILNDYTPLKTKGVGDDSDASWQEFLQQGREGIGFGDVVQAETGEALPMPVRRVAGFVGDVAFDPLTYLTLGTGTAAGSAARGSTRVAVADGSGRMISKELAETAFEKGLQDIPEVQRLVVDAAARGRGAITARGLARNGIDDVTREALGIPTLARTIGKDGIRIPGSRAIANTVEDLKGVIKKPLRTSAATQRIRGLGQNKLGARNLERIIFSRDASLGQKFDAIATKTTINRSLATARDWAVTAEQRIIKDPALGKNLTKLSQDEGRLVTEAIESGADVPMANEIRQVMSQLRDEVRELGVDVGDMGPNYVPHMVTDEFRALARKNPEAARVLVSLDSDVGFQMKRVYGVNPGQTSTFMGEQLTRGTIEEMNGIALKKIGAKVFVDDVRDTLPRYIGMMGDAVARAQQIKLLQDKGIVRELAVKEAYKAIPPTPEEKAALQEARQQLRKAKQNEKIALKDGTILRRKELGLAREAIQNRRAEIARRVDELDMNLKDLARDRFAVESKLARAQSKLESIQHGLDEWTKVVKEERGPARRRALAEVRKLEKRLAQVSDEVAKATEVAARHKPGGIAHQSLQAWQAELGRLTPELDRLREQADELLLKQNPPGAGPLPSDRRVAQASAALQAQQLKTAGLSDEAAQAASVFDAALADQRLSIEELNLAEAELDKMWDQATKLPPKDRAVTRELAQEYRDRVNVLRQIMQKTDMDNTTRAMAAIETQAMLADIAAMKAGRQIATMEVLISTMSNPKFQTETSRFVENGMVRLGENLQIPGWLDEAVKMEPVRMNAVQANKYVRKFYNLWKGYAILRPGFHVRNAYSGMYNMYLEAGVGAFPNFRRAHQFDVMAMKHPDKYMEMATQRWGQAEAEMLNAAYMAMRGTGAGQAAGEFTSGALHASKKLNPTSQDFVALKTNQKWGEWVERHLRVAHAYDVLKRGGTLDQAMDTVNKWHFNYLDISQFDQNMKLIMPFWMFFSRNMALQAQTWVSKAPKLSRTYMNVERNWTLGEEDDTYVPDWFNDAAAIRMGGPDANGAQRYLFPDLPAMQAPAQFDKFSEPWTGQFLGDVGPVKLPFELMAGKQFFSGIPFKNQPVEAGVAGQALNALGLTPDAADGTPMIDDRLQYAINSLIPGASQVDRLGGMGGAGNAERQGYNILGAVTGIGIRENNDRTRQGEQYRRQMEAEAEDARRRALGF